MSSQKGVGKVKEIKGTGFLFFFFLFPLPFWFLIWVWGRMLSMGHLAVICPHYKGKTESSKDALRKEDSTSWQVWNKPMQILWSQWFWKNKIKFNPADTIPEENPLVKISTYNGVCFLTPLLPPGPLKIWSWKKQLNFHHRMSRGELLQTWSYNHPAALPRLQSLTCES